MKTPDKFERWVKKNNYEHMHFTETTWSCRSSLLMEAVRRDPSGECVRTMLAVGCNVDVRCSGCSLLNMAVIRNDVTMVSKLISYGADVNLDDPLQHVHRTMDPEIVELLLRSGARIYPLFLQRAAIDAFNCPSSEPILRKFIGAGGTRCLPLDHDRSKHPRMWKAILKVVGGDEGIVEAEREWVAAVPGRRTKSAAKK